MLLESWMISLFASVPFSSACSVDSKSENYYVCYSKRFCLMVWLMCVTDMLIASCC